MQGHNKMQFKPINWTIKNMINTNLNWNIATQDSALENVIGKMVAILYQPQYVNYLPKLDHLYPV